MQSEITGGWGFWVSGEYQRKSMSKGLLAISVIETTVTEWVFPSQPNPTIVVFGPIDFRPEALDIISR